MRVFIFRGGGRRYAAAPRKPIDRAVCRAAACELSDFPPPHPQKKTCVAARNLLCCTGLLADVGISGHAPGERADPSLK